MRAAIHKALHWTAGTSISLWLAAVTLGGENVRLQVSEALQGIWGDQGSRIAVIAVLTVGVLAWVVTSEVVWAWLTKPRRLPPTLYLRNNENLSYHGDKSFWMEWNAKTLSTSFRGDDYDGISADPSKEETLTFSLFNAGDSPVRHVELRWEMPSIDVRNIVESGGLFGASLKCIGAREMKMSGEGRGGIWPYTADVKCLPIPVINPGESVTVEAPQAFTLAYVICALTKAKRHRAASTLLPEPDMLDMLEKWRVRMDDALVHLVYVENGARRRHSFRVVGWAWGGSPPLMRNSTDDAYENVEGTVAVVDHVEVMPA